MFNVGCSKANQQQDQTPFVLFLQSKWEGGASCLQLREGLVRLHASAADNGRGNVKALPPLVVVLSYYY